MTDNTVFLNLTVRKWRKFAYVYLDPSSARRHHRHNRCRKKHYFKHIHNSLWLQQAILVNSATEKGRWLRIRYRSAPISVVYQCFRATDRRCAGRATSMSGQLVDVGKITYSNGIESAVQIHQTHTQSYGLQISYQQEIMGLHVGSHRSLTNYQPMQSTSLQSVNSLQAYQLCNQEIIARYGSGHLGLSPIYRIKETLIGMTAFGEGNTYLQPNEQMLLIFTDFIKVLRKVLPPEVGFRSLLIRVPDIVLQTASGDFVLDSASGGINALIGVA